MDPFLSPYARLVLFQPHLPRCIHAHPNVKNYSTPLLTPSCAVFRSSRVFALMLACVVVGGLQHVSHDFPCCTCFLATEVGHHRIYRIPLPGVPWITLKRTCSGSDTSQSPFHRMKSPLNHQTPTEVAGTIFDFDRDSELIPVRRISELKHFT